MLKISVLEQSGQSAILLLDGAVTGPWVDELKLSCTAALIGGRALTLDLTGVSFLSREAVSLIGTLMAEGVVVRNCSSFVAAQLDAASVRPGA